jgi:choline-glycine betaine transporter
VIGSLILTAGKDANPMDALKAAMIIGALPFTMIMGLMVISLAKALFNDSRREKAGAMEAQPAE